MSRTLTQSGLSVCLLSLGALLAFYGPSVQAGGVCSVGVTTPCASTNVFGADWDNPAIWGLQLPGYPDNNAGVAGLWAELVGPASITLNINVAIEGLVVRPGATLRMTHLGVGDLTIKSGLGGGIINEGAIRIACGRTIHITDGSFTISENGSFDADPIPGVETSASLTAEVVTVLFSGCGKTARLEIVESMVVRTTLGDLVLDGRGVLSCPGGLDGAASRGGKTPPVLKVGSPTTVSSRGQVGPGGAAEIEGKRRTAARGRYEENEQRGSELDREFHLGGRG